MCIWCTLNKFTPSFIFPYFFLFPLLNSVWFISNILSIYHLSIYLSIFYISVYHAPILFIPQCPFLSSSPIPLIPQDSPIYIYISTSHYCYHQQQHFRSTFYKEAKKWYWAILLFPSYAPWLNWTLRCPWGNQRPTSIWAWSSMWIYATFSTQFCSCKNQKEWI
jgi:hypothetical protein